MGQVKSEFFQMFHDYIDKSLVLKNSFVGYLFALKELSQIKIRLAERFAHTSQNVAELNVNIFHFWKLLIENMVRENFFPFDSIGRIQT